MSDPGSEILTIGKHNFRISSMEPDHAPQVLKLFNAVFGQAADTHWSQWKRCNGQLRAVGLWDDAGELVAHYAGLPRQLLRNGEPMSAMQICDVMVAPHVRGLMTRRGPFFHVCQQFFSTWIGPGRPHAVAFGFPNLRHMQLGDRLDLYHHGGDIHLLQWAAREQSLPWRWRWGVLATNSPSFDRTLLTAWQSMQEDFADCVIGMRNVEYLRWRFVERPDRHYRLFCLRHWWGGIAAVVVMHLAAGSAELLDVIGARNVIPAAVRAAVSEAARAGATELTAWASQVAATVLDNDATRKESGAALAIAKASTLTADQVATASWWWMGGDTDFR